MRFRIVVAVVASVMALGMIPAEPALARAKQKIVRRCDPLPYRPYTFNDLIFGRPAPQPNGCAPAVYQYGKYVGQDPDPNIRAQLARDPRTGYDPY
jgi:hypothetical protein